MKQNSSYSFFTNIHIFIFILILISCFSITDIFYLSTFLYWHFNFYFKLSASEKWMYIFIIWLSYVSSEATYRMCTWLYAVMWMKTFVFLTIKCEWSSMLKWLPHYICRILWWKSNYNLKLMMLMICISLFLGRHKLLLRWRWESPWTIRFILSRIE